MADDEEDAIVAYCATLLLYYDSVYICAKIEEKTLCGRSAVYGQG